MKTARILLTALALGAATTPALAAGDWKFLPVADKGYAPAFVASVTGGIMDPQHVGSGDAWGLELAFNCGLVQTPTGVVRTKLSVLVDVPERDLPLVTVGKAAQVDVSAYQIGRASCRERV